MKDTEARRIASAKADASTKRVFKSDDEKSYSTRAFAAIGCAIAQRIPEFARGSSSTARLALDDDHNLCSAERQAYKKLIALYPSEFRPVVLLDHAFKDGQRVLIAKCTSKAKHVTPKASGGAGGTETPEVQ